MDNAYVLILAFSAIVVILSKGRKPDQMYWFWVVVLTFFSAVRDPNVFRDMPNYVSYFYTGQYETTLTTENVNIGYEYLTKFVKLFTNSFAVFEFLTSLGITFSFALFNRKYSPYPYISMFLYVLLIYFPSFFLLRQYLAIAVSLFAFKYILDRNLKKFLFWLIIAVSLHTSAVVLVPLYFLYVLPDNKLTRWGILVGSIVLVFSLKIVATNLFVFSEYYSGYLDSDYEASIGRLLMKLFYLMLFYCVFRKHCFENGIIRLMFLCIISENIIYLGSSGIDGVFRLRAYFELCEIIGLPLLMKECHLNKFKNTFIIRTSIMLYFILIAVSCYLLLTGGNFEYGYKTIL